MAAPFRMPGHRGRVVRQIMPDDRKVAFWFLLPSLLGLFAVFLLLPLFASLALSFTNWQLIGKIRLSSVGAITSTC